MSKQCHKAARHKQMCTVIYKTQAVDRYEAQIQQKQVAVRLLRSQPFKENTEISDSCIDTDT